MPKVTIENYDENSVVKDLSPQAEPLLKSNKTANSTITSMDSALSDSDNCSDIELDNIVTSKK